MVYFLGNSISSASRWMVSVEGKVACILHESANFLAALAVFFAAYYVLNLQYQDEA